MQLTIRRKPLPTLILRTVGMNYIAYASFVDFLRDPFRGGAKHLVAYLPFTVLAIAGPILRLAASVQRVGRFTFSKSSPSRL